MIKLIIESLKYANGETENLRIAQGKYKEKTINLNVDSKKATKGLNDLEKSIDGVNKEVKETSKSTQAMSGTLDKATGGAVSKFAAFKGAIGGVTTGFKSLKVAIIGTGIGALLIAVTSLGQAFTRSEEGQNKFAKILGVIGSVTGNLLDLLADLGENIISVFENPKQSIKDFANLIKDNIVNRFEGLLNLIPNLGKAVEQLFKGNFKEAGKIAADSVGKVVLGVDSVTDSLDNAVESVKAFGKEIKADSEAASKIADQRATAEKKARDLIVSRAQAEQDIARLREKAVNKDKFTAEERIKFLEEAGKISGDLAAKETEVAKLRLEAKLTENALTKSNKDDLNEAAQLEASVIQLETQRLNLQKRLSTELLTARNEAKASAKEEPEVIDKKLLKIQEIQEAYKQKQKDKDAETELEKINLEEERKLAELDRLNATEEQKLEIENYYSGLRVELTDKESKQKIDLENKVKDAKLGIAKNTLSLIGQMAGKGSKVAKGVAIAQATISGVEGTINAFKTASASPITTIFPAYPFIQAGLAAGFAATNIASIKSTDPSTGGGSGGSTSSVPSIGGGGGSASLPPSFNVVGASETSALGDAVAGQTNQPVQAYVVANDVTTAQSLENNIIEGATI
jgi:hypothetical protein